jgi:hypothetical protein
MNKNEKVFIDLFERMSDDETIKTFYGTFIEPDQVDFDVRDFRPVTGQTAEKAAVNYLKKFPLLLKRQNYVSVLIAGENKFPTVVLKIDLVWGQGLKEE